MTIVQKLEFAESVKVELNNARVTLKSQYRSLSFPSGNTPFEALVHMIETGEGTYQRIIADERLDAVAMAERIYFLDQLNCARLLDTSFEGKKGLILSIRNYTRAKLAQLWCKTATQLVQNSILTLSLHATLRCENGIMRLESPFTTAYGEITNSAALELIHALAKPTSHEDLIRHFPEPLVDVVIYALHNLRLLDGQEIVGPFWQTHDLLFHARSRLGRNLESYGGTYRFRGQIPPLPAIKPQNRGGAEGIALAIAPETELSKILSRRHSTREFMNEPLDVDMLGAFLYLTARITCLFKVDGMDVTSRPYPTGGAAYDLEIYVLAHDIARLDRGIYHYSPETHALFSVEANPEIIEDIATQYAQTYLSKTPPQIALLITSRFGRVAWKYSAMAYALVLKHVGVLCQTFYLAAAELGLGACALGGGNSDLFAQATGIDFYQEPLVGEFIIGRKKDGHDEGI